MKLPNAISRAVLRELGIPAEAVTVRLILHDVASEVRYRLCAPRRAYIFERDHKENRHILDLPVSLWMDGAKPGKWSQDTSICEDIRQSGRSVSVQVLTGETAAAAPSENHDDKLAARALRAAKASKGK